MKLFLSLKRDDWHIFSHHIGVFLLVFPLSFHYSIIPMIPMILFRKHCIRWKTSAPEEYA